MSYNQRFPWIPPSFPGFQPWSPSLIISVEGPDIPLGVELFGYRDESTSIDVVSGGKMKSISIKVTAMKDRRSLFCGPLVVIEVEFLQSIEP